MRRFASLAGVSLIAGGLTALLLFASSARALPDIGVGSALSGDDISLAQDGSGPGSGETTTTSTTIGGNGSGATTTTVAGATTTTVAGATTSTTAGGSTSSSSTTSSTAARPTITASSQSVPAGGTVQITGANWPANTDISLVLNSTPVNVGSVRSDAGGRFSIVITVPRGTTAGTHTLTASGGGQSAALSLLVSGSLVVTGMSWNLAILGLALLAAGVIVLAGDRIGRQELIEFV